MPVASSTDGGRSRSRRARFREWRRQRPFAGGVLLMIAGLLIAWVPMQFAFELLLVGGSYTYIGLLWSVGVFLTGAFAMYRPDLSTIFGVLGVVISILSLLGALGGLLIGMILGIIGGNLCVAWSPPGATNEKNGRNESRPERGGDDATDDRPAVRTDGGTVPDDEPPGASDDDLLGLAAGGALLDRVRRRARRAAREGTDLLRRAESGADPGRVVDAATSGWTSKRLAMTFALLVVTSGTLTLVSTIPAAAILGDNQQTSYTVDVGEIRLGEGGQICAASGSGDTYYVTITDATLVDATIYQQRGGEAVKTTFPRLEVEDTMVMETSGENDRLDMLATSLGCTEEDQTSRTVFRNHFQSSSLLRGSQGVTMLNLEAVDGAIPEPGGFQFAAPQDNETAGDNLTEVGNVTDVEAVAGDVDDVLNDSLDERLLNDTGELGDLNGTVDPVNETADAVNETVNGVDETVEAVNETAGVNETVEAVNETAGVNETVDVVNDTVGAANDTVDRVDRTLENASSGPVDAVNATDNLTNATGDVVSSVDESVENTTRRTADGEPPENATDAVDETTDTVDNTTEEVTGTTDDVTDATDEVAGTEENRTGSEVVDGTTDAVDGTTETVENTTDGATDTVDDTTEEVAGSTEETVTSTSEETETSTSDGVTGAVDDTTDEVVGSTETTTATETSTSTATTTETSTATATTTETVTETTTETDVPVTETVVPTATPEDTEDLPSWFDQVPDDEEDSVLNTIEETDGGVEDVANVTEETSHLSEDDIDADENLTQLDNGTVLLLNGTDPLDVDWGSDLPVETEVDSITGTETESDSGDDGTETETDGGSDDTLLRVAG